MIGTFVNETAVQQTVSTAESGLSIVAETHALCSFVDMTTTVPTLSSASTDMFVALTQREER
jgi:hypothetical protein